MRPLSSVENELRGSEKSYCPVGRLAGNWGSHGRLVDMEQTEWPPAVMQRHEHSKMYWKLRVKEVGGWLASSHGKKNWNTAR